MTYRIHRTTSAADVVFSLSGTLDRRVADDVATLLAAEPDRAVRLDLKDVTLVDRDAVTFLARVEAQGVVLVNCPEYARRWIEAERKTVEQGGR